MNHISIDTETLGVSRNNPAILSIGAVPFDPSSGKTGKPFYVEVDIDDAMKGTKVDASTICWWVNQSPSAKQLFNNTRKLLLEEALKQLAALIDQHTTVWFKGPAEDGAWLKSAFNRFGRDTPWRFYNTRDVRTIVEAAAMNGTEVKSVGTAHNAVDDAMYQARVICYAIQKLDAALGGTKFMPRLPVAAAVEDEDDEL